MGHSTGRQVRRRVEQIYGAVLAAPWATVTIVQLLVAWLGWNALSFKQQIEGGVEICLPATAPRAATCCSRSDRSGRRTSCSST